MSVPHISSRTVQNSVIANSSTLARVYCLWLTLARIPTVRSFCIHDMQSIYKAFLGSQFVSISTIFSLADIQDFLLVHLHCCHFLVRWKACTCPIYIWPRFPNIDLQHRRLSSEKFLREWISSIRLVCCST